ncbi:hypothetical protein AMK68_00230 [candidate division KD3-62 bacterium DG_56]|uniref:Uncharacterized protein n=1 Tax=candidate division KD3-62 bacterium DG_56 TaxID=1704032 RepID=A0A0S7XRK2_9BACT|nr:MAG: hypothetical protein AMK68_00230 [candidate division KD3-62 bacterium DG_56]
MARKPPLERPPVRLFDALGRRGQLWLLALLYWEAMSQPERDEVRAVLEVPPDYEPPALALGLEGRAELDRLMRMRPGLLGQWREEAIDRNLPEGDE